MESKEKKAQSSSTAMSPVDISRLDLRVGFIKKAWKHTGADSLYVEEILCGENLPRTVVSGLVKYVPEAEMQERKVVLVCNMKPLNMKGIKSHAMVLAAISSDESVELVEPPAEAEIGERITVQGYIGQPDEVLNPKKKVFESVQTDLKTNMECTACYKDVPLMTSKGPCRVKSITQGSIK